MSIGQKGDSLHVFLKDMIKDYEKQSNKDNQTKILVFEQYGINNYRVSAMAEDAVYALVKDFLDSGREATGDNLCCNM